MGQANQPAAESEWVMVDEPVDRRSTLKKWGHYAFVFFMSGPVTLLFVFAGAIIGLVIVPGDQLIFRSLAGANLALFISWFIWMFICWKSGTSWLLRIWLLKLPLLGMRAQAVWGFTFTLAAFVIRACQGDFAFPSWWAALGALLGLIRSPL